MTTVPLGVGSYRRDYGGMPEVVLLNRFVEKDPTNLREHITLLTRPGTSHVNSFGSAAPRATFSKKGFLNGDLFVVSGTTLYRWDGTTKTAITGTVNNNGTIRYAWQKGIGYERLFIADGLLLNYYAGGTHATGTLTYAPGSITNQVIQIGGVYYSWNASVDTGSPAGTAAAPWLANPYSDPLLSMSNLLNFNGVRGTDFSTALGGPATLVTSSVTDASGNAYGAPGYTPPATHLIITARSEYSDGNSISTTVYSGSYLTWGGTTLSGGGVHALVGVAVPAGQTVKALASSNSYVLVSISDSQKFYWINPGDTTIDALNFAEKESNPDNIVDMLAVGDFVLIFGNGSTENWYATGDLNAPWAPQEGRVYQRGVVEGTPVVVKDDVIFVGDDGVVYSVGYSFGTTAQWGVHRISNNGIEERVRYQLRREQGLTP